MVSTNYRTIRKYRFAIYAKNDEEAEEKAVELLKKATDMGDGTHLIFHDFYSVQLLKEVKLLERNDVVKSWLEK